MTAAIVDDTTGGTFSVESIVAYEVERHDGRIVDVTKVGSSDGLTPLSVRRGDMVTVTVRFTPREGRLVGRAVLVIAGSAPRNAVTWAPIHVPLRAGVRLVQTTLPAEPLELRRARA